MNDGKARSTMRTKTSKIHRDCSDPCYKVLTCMLDSSTGGRESSPSKASPGNRPCLDVHQLPTSTIPALYSSGGKADRSSKESTEVDK